MNATLPVRVLVVESSEPTRRFLVERLQADPQISVVHAAADARSALEFLARHRPDAVLMAHAMPALDGFETTRRIMETRPLPIVICADVAAGDDVFRSLEAGAVACVAKPDPQGDCAAAVAHLQQTVKLMSEVKVVRRWSHHAHHAHHGPHPGGHAAPPTGHVGSVVGIGASTGGPPVLQGILAQLPNAFALPVMVVQHIARGFLPGMADWLRQTSGLKVQIGAHGMPVQPGHVYLAPDDFQMTLTAEGRIALARPALQDGLCPSVDCLFRSLAEVCGSRAIGVLLSGMGKDGAVQLKALRDGGGVTIAQDKASSVVHGMPGEAIGLGAARHVLPPERIAQLLIALAQERSESSPCARVSSQEF